VEEKIQSLIYNCEDFNTIDAFRFIDEKAKGYVEPHELVKGIKKIGVDY
jgi:hypothetical protein